MDKKVSVADVKNIMKYNKYESKTVTYECGDKNVDIIVNPAVEVEWWFSSILSGVSLMYDLGFEGETPEFAYAIDSVAYRYSLVTCFTNISDKISNSDLIKFVQLTDIASRVEASLPEGVLASFRNDYTKVSELSATKNSSNAKIEAFCDRNIDFLNSLGSLRSLIENAPLEEIMNIGLAEQDADK